MYVYAKKDNNEKNKKKHTNAVQGQGNSVMNA